MYDNLIAIRCTGCGEVICRTENYAGFSVAKCVKCSRGENDLVAQLDAELAKAQEQPVPDFPMTDTAVEQILAKPAKRPAQRRAVPKEEEKKDPKEKTSSRFRWKKRITS